MPCGTIKARLAILLLLLSLSIVASHGVLLVAQEFTGVASVWNLGMGARPLAMGNAFVGLADDANALLFNPAGLAWERALSISSSCEVRSSTTTYGQVSIAFANIGLGVNCFDFGEVYETDEFGTTIGTFSYRSYLVIAGAGITAADLPFVSSTTITEALAFGISAKLHRVNTLDPGDGSGFSIDLPVLIRFDNPWFGRPFLTRFSFGLRLQDVLGSSIAYASGHEESWFRRAVIGTSLELLEKLTVAADVASDGGMHFGLEWRPVPALSIQCGARNEDIWMWSLGVGTNVRNLSVNLAMVIHPYLHNQFRGTVGFAW